jgi:hypothetical protein
LATLLIWGLIAVVVQFLVLRLAKALTRRSGHETAKIVVDVSRRPLVVTVMLVGIVASLVALQTEAAWIAAAHRWLTAAILVLGSYWL